MSLLTALYAGLFYFAALVLVSGLTYKLVQYTRTPAPLLIPTTPAPTTRVGVALRMVRELVFFESGFRGNKGTWIFGWVFHCGLLLVTLRHLRYFLEPVPAPILFVQPLGVYGGYAMLFGLIGRWVRRLGVDRIRWCSAPSDHLILGLFLLLVVSGLLTTLVVHTDIVGVKSFFIGLHGLDPTPLPADPMLLLHLALAAVLMIIFPYSKLLHAVGALYSPTRNQVDDPRERRHLAPWASRLS